MPNHVHVLLEPLFEYRLSQIMQGVKGASSRECNRIIGKSGPFWMPESYDHIVRSEKEYRHYIRYIDENPMKAGLEEGTYWVAGNPGF
jgi:REP element-mobilizing transposase RayT